METPIETEIPEDDPAKVVYNYGAAKPGMVFTKHILCSYMFYYKYIYIYIILYTHMDRLLFLDSSIFPVSHFWRRS